MGLLINPKDLLILKVQLLILKDPLFILNSSLLKYYKYKQLMKFIFQFLES